MVHGSHSSCLTILSVMVASELKFAAVNANPGFEAHVMRLGVEIKVPTPIETIIVSALFAAVAAKVASASAAALLPAPLGSPSVRRRMR